MLACITEDFVERARIEYKHRLFRKVRHVSHVGAVPVAVLILTCEGGWRIAR